MGTSEVFDVKGKSVAVTGGAMGIGYGIAKRFVEAGARVLIVDVNEKAARAAAERLGTEAAAPLAVDIASDEAGAALVAGCVKAFGSLDVLVNNAGIFPTVPMLKMTPEQFDRVYRINLRGLALASQSAALQMIKQGHGGTIINIGSVDSLHPSMVGLAAYDASKGGVLMFTRSLALELAPSRIRVNAILPGGVETEGTARPLEGSGMTEAQAREFKAQFVKARVPLGRMGVPDDIAKVALFLASPAADYITGASLTVDGGMLLT